MNKELNTINFDTSKTSYSGDDDFEELKKEFPDFLVKIMVKIMKKKPGIKPKDFLEARVIYKGNNEFLDQRADSINKFEYI